MMECWKDRILTAWNTGVLEEWAYDLPHHSIIPAFQLPAQGRQVHGNVFHFSLHDCPE
jgi:hypothetical protein